MNPSTALARVFVDELVRCGVREAVLSPGSRSTPLALALHAESRIRLHVRVDERSAGFLAVGLAKVSRRAVVLVCTSGTAAVNLHPAVVEAHHAHVPLIVLTADRPPELRGTGANQTIDQTALYGSAVRLFADVGVPEPVHGMVAYWRSSVARAVIAAHDGPVHLNVPLREPLVPDGSDDWPESLAGRPGGAPWVRAEPLPREAATQVELPQRGAVVVGEGAADPDAAVALAEAAGWPLLSEPTGDAHRGANAVGCYPLLLADGRFAATHRPDMVITVGKPGLSRGLLAWLRTAHRHVVVDPHRDWADPTRTAEAVFAALPRVNASRTAETPWLASWRRHAAAAGKAVDAVLRAEDGLSGPRLARELGGMLPDGALLFAGGSRSIRELESYLPCTRGVRMLGNRGANGIDGLVSTAVGAALAHRARGGGPAYALLGDLSYLHDRNGLLLGPDEPRPDLTFIVVDNDGGGIFSQLPQAGVPGFERLFGTPHGVDLRTDVATVGVPYRRVLTLADLADALSPAPGLRVVHVRTDRSATVALERRVRDAVHGALSP